MTSTLQHIEDLDRDAWAALTKRAAVTAVTAAERLGTKPPAVLAVMAAMTEHDLVEHRNRFGPERKRLSLVMQLVEADQLRIAAERQAREAQQDQHDAEAAASMARAEAEQSARAATEARERARAAEAAAAREQVSAAEARAEQGIAQRAAERAAAEQALQEVRAELERVRADAAAEVGAAHGQASGEIDAAHRAAEAEVSRARAEARDGVARSQAEVERVRADAAAEVAAVREQADGEIAAAREAAEAEVARARAEADDARLAAEVVSSQLLTIPIPPLGVRAHTAHIEDALSAVRQIDYVLEVGGAEDVESERSVELVRSLVRTVQEQARDLSEELRDLPSRYSADWQVDAAAGYARAAASAYGAFLQRIAAATEQLTRTEEDTDAEVIELVTTMLGEHPWRRR